MAISKLSLVSINFDKNQYNDVLLKLYERDDFHPELSSKFTDSVAGLSAYNNDNLYEELLVRIDEMTTKYHFKVQEIKTDTELNVIKAKEFLDDLFLDIDRIHAVKEQLQKMIAENDDAITQLNHVEGSNINFDDLFNCQYLVIRFGKLPIHSENKLAYYDAVPFSYKSFKKDEKFIWCMYVTTPQDAPEVDNIFTSLYFEKIHIPEFVHGSCELAEAEIEEESNLARKYSENLDARITHLIQDNINDLNRIYSIAKQLNSVYVMQKYIVRAGDKLIVHGFVLKNKEIEFKKTFEEIRGVNVDILPATSDMRLEPPTKLKNSWFALPFRMFVEMYGVPKYTDVDPTLLVAISYTLLFGIMFGDLGQGIILSLVGLFAQKKLKMQLGGVGVRLGISSAIFGLFFGSVFGNEEFLAENLKGISFFNAMSPDNTMTLLLAAIGLGVILILVSMIFNIILNVKKKNIGEAILSQNGICGVTFYVAVLGLALSVMMGFNFVNPLYILLLIVLPLILIFLKEPLIRKFEEHEPMFPSGFGAFFVEGFFELFEVVLSFITNTMSFLRVGGFVLSHAGMMLVVYTLASMVGGIGEIIVLILGNIFVMCLEGLIVGIQVLRLEFYEMFSRYYEGNGIPFKTIKEQNV